MGCCCEPEVFLRFENISFIPGVLDETVVPDEEEAELALTVLLVMLLEAVVTSSKAGRLSERPVLLRALMLLFSSCRWYFRFVLETREAADPTLGRF